MTSQSTFICLKCGNTMNADYNAAKNIVSPNIKTRLFS
ncbi:zinc ribbon domain-containing protein [Ruminiclostridium hungatei]